MPTLIDNAISPRQGFIGKELDSESDLADHGVRKYDYITGRFMAMYHHKQQGSDLLFE
ncbi:MAG: hypothetical protein ACK6DA_00230 [Candidatus Kapaibacterium sp.]